MGKRAGRCRGMDTGCTEPCGLPGYQKRANGLPFLFWSPGVAVQPEAGRETPH